MRKVCLTALLAAAFLMSGSTGSLLAQGKKGTGTIEVNESAKDGKFRLAIRNADGKYLAGSSPTGFATEKEALAALEELKAVLAKGSVVKQKKGEAEDKKKDGEKKTTPKTKDKAKTPDK
ncbi:MAG: hypothetical protein EBV06_02630 [Planctomycetia bacterium]|nr:hypothetical protein [Planctomycetia bacterium]